MGCTMTEFSPVELMTLHLKAAFTCDGNSRLLTVNEPWDGTVPAPRFFLGRTIDGCIIRKYRYDLDDALTEKLETLSGDEIKAAHFTEPPKHREKYLELLGAEKFSMGPCFMVPPRAGNERADPRIEFVTRETIGKYSIEGFEWLLDEIDLVQPCAGYVHEGRLVSQCRSVRISGAGIIPVRTFTGAIEAGVETLPGFRGRGYAPLVTAAWAAAVREQGALPLYSTSWNNDASQRVAKKLGLYYYGNSFSVK